MHHEFKTAMLFYNQQFYNYFIIIIFLINNNFPHQNTKKTEANQNRKLINDHWNQRKT